MIDILLASYNGEKYIAEQIESIMGQTYKDFTLIINDDASTDGTCDIIEKYIAEYPERIKLYRSETPSGSAKNNFFSMSRYVTSDYIMFADQDDVWLPNKVELSMEAMEKLQSKHPNRPLLVHTDLKVVTEDLKCIHESFKRYVKISYGESDFTKARLFMENHVTGCTTLMNRKLFELCFRSGLDTTHVRMHDWWIGITAAFFGEIGYVTTPTILYRQHSDNSVGAKKATAIWLVAKSLCRLGSIKEEIRKTYRQGELFARTYEDMCATLNEHDAATVAAFADMVSANKIRRLYLTLRYGFLQSYFVRKAGQILLV